MAGTKHGTGSMWSRGDVLDLPGHRWFHIVGHAHDSNDRYCPARVRQECMHAIFALFTRVALALQVFVLL